MMINRFQIKTLIRFRLDEDFTKLKLDLNCDRLSIKGKYEMSGHLIALPIEGKGDYESVAGKF